MIDIDSERRVAVQVALGDALSAVVAQNVDAARRALQELRQTGAVGAVLALNAITTVPSTPLINNGTSLRSHVRAKAGAHETQVNRLLDVLLSRVSLADSFDGAVDAALRDPNAVVVTRDGDRLAATSLRVGLGLVSNVALASAQQSAQDAAARLLDAQLALHTARTGLTEARDSEARAATTAEVERAAVQDHDIEIAGLEQRENLLRARMAEIEGRLGGDSDARRDAARQTQRIDQEMLKIATAFTAVEHIVNVLNTRQRELHELRARQSTEMRQISSRLDASRKERTAKIQIGSRGNQWMKGQGNADWVYGYDAWNVPLATA